MWLVRTLGGIAAALGLIASMVTLARLRGNLPNAGSPGRAEFLLVASLTLLKSPSRSSLQLLPFVFLFGAMGAFVTLNRRSELVAMRAAGASACGHHPATAITAFGLGVFTISTVLNPASAALSGRFEGRRAELAGESDMAFEDIWLRQGDDRSQIVIHARGHDSRRQVVRLERVSLFIQNIDHGGQFDFARRLEASQARLEPGAWKLTDVREALPGSPVGVFPGTVDPLRPPRPAHGAGEVRRPAAVTASGLPATIRAAQIAGFRRPTTSFGCTSSWRRLCSTAP